MVGWHQNGKSQPETNLAINTLAKVTHVNGQSEIGWCFLPRFICSCAAGCLRNIGLQLDRLSRHSWKNT